LGPVTEVGFGVLLALGLAAGDALALAAGDAAALAAGDAPGLPAGEVWGAALGEAEKIGQAAVVYFSAKSASANFTAWLIGIRAIPLLLSTQP